LRTKGGNYTRLGSWGFMGLEDSYGVIPSNSIWKKAKFGEDFIIANLDTGDNFPYLLLL